MRQTPLLRWFCRSLLAALLACNWPAISFGETKPTPAPTTKADPNFQLDLRRSVEYLASDELEGRGIGTAGIDKAAHFIADAFTRLGVRPVPGLEGYFQSFTISAATAPDASTTFSAAGKSYKLGDDFSVVSFSAEDKFTDAPIVFAGYGVTNEEAGYD